jgi:hypothetical protein
MKGVTRLASGEGDAGEFTLPCVLNNTHFSDAVLVGAIAPVRAAAVSLAPILLPERGRSRTEA